MNDNTLKALLAIHQILSEWAEDHYIKTDPLGSMALGKFRRYRDDIRRDIQTDKQLQDRLGSTLDGLSEDEKNG